MKSSLDYRLLPNLQVGLNTYLYRPDAGDNLSLSRPFGDRVMGLGPGIKYDLGRWSFILKSQLETGNRDQRPTACKARSGSGTPSKLFLSFPTQCVLPLL